MKIKRGLMVLILTFLMSGCSFRLGDFEYFDSESMDEIIDKQLEQNRETGENAYDSFVDKTESIYYDTLDRVMDSTMNPGEQMPLSERFFRSGYELYNSVKSLAPFIVPGSIFLGAIIWLVSRKNKGIRKVGVYGFMIGFPMLIIVFVYGFGVLIDMFLA